MPNGKDYIVYQNTKRGDRKITFIDGYAFYQSTGTNSGFEATWFPFLGVADPDSDDQRYKLDSYANNRGHFIKPNIFFRDIPEEVESAGKYLGLNEDFFYRMGNLECLLISSLIKEGYWLTNKGILFKEHLQKTYPAFYQQYGDIEFSADPLQVIPSAEPFRVNDWLLIQGPMKKIATTKKADDLTIADKRKQFAKGKISPRNDVDAMEIDSIAETSIKPYIKRSRSTSVPTELARQNARSDVFDPRSSPMPAKEKKTKQKTSQQASSSDPSSFKRIR
ncbi:MAG: hypothetical protein BGO43_06785 [Gammaproteobacteria bacterium 39-13]|nr:hypothetical protein [Gammaproteobacteria bacterium]OJV90542.1 MAG: hypothetical protein BGO43_06785 [Gammaproteobacteria bacterium 39-13]